MSKQDRTFTRTASDLERKYAFGQTFAEVYDLVSDAQKAANEASAAVDTLDKTLTPQEIFNRLTGYKNLEGVFRDVDDNIYINASYVFGEILEGDNLKVAAANITGQLTATQIDATNLSVNAAKITGSLTAGVLESSLKVLASAIEAGTIEAGVIDATLIDTDSLIVDAAKIEGTLESGIINLNGWMGIYEDEGEERYGFLGYVVSMDGEGNETHGVGIEDEYSHNFVVATSGGAAIRSKPDSLKYSEVFAGENIRLTTTGLIYAGGDTIGESDRRLKEDIRYDVDRYLAIFDALKPATFSWIKKTDKSRHLGMIAQEVEEAMSNAGIAKEDFAALHIQKDGTYGLAYNEFIPLLIAKVQQLDAEIKEMKNNG